MSDMKFHKRYHADAWDGCLTLSLEERGVYSTILDMIYMANGRVKLDYNYLASVMRCRPSRLRRLVEGLVSNGKLFIENGHIGNARADEEIADAYNRSKRLSDALVKARVRKNTNSKRKRHAEMTSIADANRRSKAAENCEEEEATEPKSAEEVSVELNSVGVELNSVGVELNSVGVELNSPEKLLKKQNKINDRYEPHRSLLSQTSHCKQTIYKNKKLDNNHTVIVDGPAVGPHSVSLNPDILYRGLEGAAKIPISDRLIQSIQQPRTGEGAALVARRRTC